MQIINGRWVVDDNLTPVDDTTCSKLLELGKKVQSIYGENITYDRIKLISQLNSLQDTDERVLNRIIEEGHIAKIA
jgi:hypothetical protein